MAQKTPKYFDVFPDKNPKKPVVIDSTAKPARVDTQATVALGGN
jgi:hypothetical protein